MTSSTVLKIWSWSDRTGQYQYYIVSPIQAYLLRFITYLSLQHGSENVTSYVNLDLT
jgi:hypothetical protein